LYYLTGFRTGENLREQGVGQSLSDQRVVEKLWRGARV
jgi:hypothetical protein